MAEASNAAPGELTPEEANRIIHSHRKVRYGTACWPCRQRKVKCDNKLPCDNCVKRDHAQLCSYKPNRMGSAKSTSTASVDSNHNATSYSNLAATSSPNNNTAPNNNKSHITTAGSNSRNNNNNNNYGLTLAAAKKRAHSSDSSEGRRTSLEPFGESAIRLDSDVNEMSRYLGQNSIPALLREQASPSRQEEGGVEYIRQDMRSILGLDNSAPFPLMSARHLDKLTVDIAAELPSDREVMKLFHAYKEVPHPFWGFVLDIDALESKLMVYLEDRAKNAKNAQKPTTPVSASWLAILFAVLAVGSQYHDSPYHIRTRDSQKYIQISFHFLRVGNFLLRPNLDSIQAMLMTSFVLLNDMKAEASWALLGLTTRLAQSLGLDRAQPYDGRASPDLQKRELLRRSLWYWLELCIIFAPADGTQRANEILQMARWTIVWHDCLTSLSFDRTPMTSHTTCPIPIGPHALEGWKYLEGMYHLCQIIGNRLSPEVAAAATYEQILQNCHDVEAIRTKMVPHLRSKEACRSALDRLHYYAIRLHTAFVVSVCCRPALRRSGGGGGSTAARGTTDTNGTATTTTTTTTDVSPLTPEQKRVLADKCKDNLTDTVRMFLAMHQLSVIPTRSWAFTYHGLSSAVLLGILGETKADPEVRGLQGDLIEALSATAAKEQTSPPAHIQRTDRDIELSGPLSRALAALKNIYDHGSVVGQASAPSVAAASAAAAPPSLPPPPKPDDALAGTAGYTVSAGTGTSTPLQQQQQLTHGSAIAGVGGPLVGADAYGKGVDPHQDAALTMAEMQNGGLDLGMLPAMQPQNTLPDLSNIDPTTYLSPMDLYDQIFWESPEPWNMGADTMNFDFMAQPPPGQAQQQFYF
ncbi:c6 zinc finger domain containing protein [Niveomyces insectorum RCEF 264]|uniref:C6 zinc finger domain containing protein n=1 Tax=Niveomyces insectorum RCEF 264 TaxID=1081102 RepID=A0A167P6Z7_9HYPO|nr:c6 zinc finger domain containing protein [Niveomyces insectorum RCEF 264]